MESRLQQFGAWILLACESAGFTVALGVQALLRCGDLRLRARETLQQMFHCGVLSLPVVALVGVFSGMVLALQAGIQLGDFGQEENIGMVVGLAMVREMGPIMTAIILAGMVGSAMAAEVGTMSVSEEVDALRVMAIDPVSFLVLPRLLGMLLMAPVMTVYADIIGLIGGGVVSKHQLGVHYSIYFNKAMDSLVMTDVVSGLVKAVVFAAIIATISCAQGLRAVNGAEDVGKAVRNSVVISFVLIIVFNYFLTSFTRPLY